MSFRGHVICYLNHVIEPAISASWALPDLCVLGRALADPGGGGGVGGGGGGEGGGVATPPF